MKNSLQELVRRTGGRGTYIYNRGDGSDFIRDEYLGANVLSFGAGISANDITPIWDNAARKMTLDLGGIDKAMFDREKREAANDARMRRAA